MIHALSRLAVRNTLRRHVRTLLTAGMVMLGVALLLVALSWIRGVTGSMLSGGAASTGHVRVVTRGFAAREELMPLYEHLPNVAPLVEVLRRQPGVVAVEPRITTGVTVTVGEEIGDVFAAAVGASERYFREQLGAKEKLVQGGWLTGAPDEIVAGSTVARQAGAKIGDELILLGMTQDGSLSPIKGRLVGIVHGGGGGLDRQLLVPLERMQYLTDISEGALELLVYGESYREASQLAARLKAVPALGEYEVQAWMERDPYRSIVGTVQGVQGLIMGFFVFLTALGIWNTMMMSVLERTAEIGVLRAMGLSRLGVVGIVVGEALAIAVIGGLVGVGLGAYPAWLLESKGVRLGERVASSSFVPETIHGELTLETVLAALALGLLMALLGSALPALRAASIQPVSAMRSGR